MRPYIQWLGFRNHIAPKKPYLNQAHIANRLVFVHKYLHWSEQDWSKVIWINESSFELGKNSQLIQIWHRVNKKFAKSCLAPTFKSGQTSIMVWGAFTVFDKCPLVIMPPKERTVTHFVKNVSERGLRRFYSIHDQPHEFTLMEDGAPVHQSKLSKNWREAQCIKKLDWPSNSPNLNPIGNLWKILKDLFHHYNKPSNKLELILTIQAIWNAIYLQQLQRLISSMPDRMQAMISAKRGSTR